MITEIEERYIQAFDKSSRSTVSVLVAAPPMRSCHGPFRRHGVGSGVVLDKDGHILTNQHVVRHCDQIMIALNNGHVFPGKVVGGDERTDVAVVRIETDELTPAELGDSDELRVGQPILAIGNSLGLPGGPTVSSGVISSLRRSLVTGKGNGIAVIQTDASVNPGNSGGPLVSLDGKVIAITTAMIPYAEGMGFAIPINKAREIAEQIIEHGRVQRSWLGVSAFDVTPHMAYQFRLPSTDGVFVSEVVPDSPAESAGMRMGDVILSLDDARLGSTMDLLAALSEKEIGEAAQVKVRRNGRVEELHVTLGTQPY